ncbi:MAG: translation initiation factor IF-2 N-terminal domain-containing protein [Planctomycetota bacterium]
MAKALRVHQLAKELGVKSKVIVEKCEAEGVPDITNHMSTVKLGLAETIRQWFGETDADHSTAIEQAEKVDLTKVRKKAARKKAKASKKADAEEPPVESETATAVMDPPAEEAAPEAVVPTDGDDAGDEPTEEVTAAATRATAKKRPTPPAEETPPAEADAEASATPAPAKPVGPVGQQNVPTRPDVVKPVGEQVKPQQAKVSGPKVVRVEKPEPAPTPRPRGPRPGGMGGGGGGPAGPAPGEVEGITRSRGPSRGGGVRGIGGGGDAGQVKADVVPRRRACTYSDPLVAHPRVLCLHK